MKVLQITSDWKWTGPAEPMLRLALALRARGHDVSIAAPEAPPGAGRGLAEEARAAGLPPVVTLVRGRGLQLVRDTREVRSLRAFLEAREIEVVHAWHTRDHLIAHAAVAARRRRGRAVLVRSLRTAEPPRATPWARWLLGPATDALVCVSPGSAERCRPLRAGRLVAGVFGAVDLERYRPAPPDPRVRSGLGLGPRHRVVGIVARVQAHRRFDLLLEAAARLFQTDPDARLLVIGRGTRRAELAEQPAVRLGIADRVVFAGYRAADYADVLRAIDVFTFLVPGSDGTCRALLEAQACGIPAVTSRRGALPELVEDGRTGLLVDEDPEALAKAWASLLGDPARRATLGAYAAQRAATRFAPDRYASDVLAVYEAARV